MKRSAGQSEQERGFGGFVRSLLSGIPWSECAEGSETLRFDAPPGDLVRLHNSNGRTRVLGEDRDDIEVRASTAARAESSEAARELLAEEGAWRQVLVLDAIDGEMDVEGWVHGRYVRPLETTPREAIASA